MNYLQKLKAYKNKTILLEELRRLCNVTSDEDLFEIVRFLSNESLLSPIKSSKTNGNYLYPLYLKYKITLPKEDYHEELKDIGSLHYQLLHNGYLINNPSEYAKHHVLIKKLNRYLFNVPSEPMYISRKERSFEIFDEEKVLDGREYHEFCNLLRKMGITEETLAFYDTPEDCFNDFIPKRKRKMCLLICENKDIWFNIRRMMYEHEATVLFKKHIDGVILGNGNAISKPGSLSNYVKFINAKVNFLYWGDIDREGLNIYLRTLRNNPDLDIELFYPAYEKMLQLSTKRSIPDSQDHRNSCDDYSQIYHAFSSPTKELLISAIENNKRIPQEIITYGFLYENMR